MTVAFAFPGANVAMMAQPNVDGRKAVSFAEPSVHGTPEEVTPSMDEALLKAEQDTLSRKSSGNQGQSSSGAREDVGYDDVVRSETPGSVKHARVVHPPAQDEYEPTFRATKEQCIFHNIIRRYENARSNNKHVKQIRKTKVIKCDATYVDVGDLADVVRPTRRFTHNVVACGIHYINKHVDISPDKIMFPMLQELAPQNPIDKCGHFYSVCLNLKHQRIEVLDSVCSESDPDIKSPAEFFIQNLKETWNRHYGTSKVQISHFKTKYIETAKQGNGRDRGYYMLEYLAKWKGRKVPVITDASVTELRKILTWERVTNQEFNQRIGAREFIDDSVKAANKKYH